MRTGFALTVEGGGTGRITAWRDPATGRWRETKVRAVVHADSTLALRTGERLVLTGCLDDLPASLPSYAELMRRRGCVGSMWLSERQVLRRQPARGSTLHAIAVGRLRRLGLAEALRDAGRARDAQALCEAMAAGERAGLSRPLREAYARSGTAHLLAVSGLHVGIVFLVANLLLGWLPALRYGHLWRSCAAAALVWLYAAAAGFRRASCGPR